MCECAHMCVCVCLYAYVCVCPFKLHVTDMMITCSWSVALLDSSTIDSMFSVQRIIILSMVVSCD